MSTNDAEALNDLLKQVESAGISFTFTSEQTALIEQYVPFFCPPPDVRRSLAMDYVKKAIENAVASIVDELLRN